MAELMDIAARQQRCGDRDRRETSDVYADSAPERGPGRSGEHSGDDPFAAPRREVGRIDVEGPVAGEVSAVLAVAEVVERVDERHAVAAIEPGARH